MIFRFKNEHFEFPSNRAIVFGILNVTPDSFSDANLFLDPEKAVQHALDLEKAGADVIDIGGESTRPGSKSVDAQTELKRIQPVLTALRSKIKIPISIDTTKPEVALEALNLGASIVNDVSGLSDERMIDVVRETRAGLIIMHTRGTPETMKTLTKYDNLLKDVAAELLIRFEKALELGIPEESIALDPGIGFAKTQEQNWEIIHHLDSLKQNFSRPFMIGVSRKSFLGKDLDERIARTIEAESLAFRKGAEMIRTHDVGRLWNEFLKAGYNPNVP